jgi:hypothetical protein
MGAPHLNDTGDAVLPQGADNKSRPIHQNSMCPAGLALHHPAAETLLNWAEFGCPTQTGKPWSISEIEEAIARGPHQSALTPEALKHFAAEIKEKVLSKQARVVEWDTIKDNPPTEPMGPSGEYSGIGSCLDKLGDALQGPELLIRPVRWQRTVAVDSGKISAFTAEVGSLLTFQAFIMMREGSVMVTTVHSIAKYFSLSAATSRYQGKYIGFVGDRLATREPGPVLLQPTKSWAWVKKLVRSNGEEVIQAYTGGLGHGLLWAPTPNGTEVEMHVPRLVCLPPVFVKLLRDQKKALMPHEVWQVVKTFSESQGLAQECVDACTFIMDWCVVASQARAPEKDLFLAFRLDSVTEQDSDVSLAVWLESRLDTTLGRRPTQGGHQGIPGNQQPQPGNTAVDAAVITQAVGQGVALGYQHLVTQRGNTPASPGGDKAPKAGDSAYSGDDVCTIMAFSGIEDPQDCQVIWTICTEKKKNVDACRRYLMKGMTDYAYNRRILIDGGIYLEQDTMKAILELCFNPGEGIAYVQSAAKGLSLLCC